jgi:PAS domain S-box-containing protein
MNSDIRFSSMTSKRVKNVSRHFTTLRGIITILDRGRILECNQGLAEITGYWVDELIGMDGMLHIH